MPPAFSQSACVVCFDISPDGLADGADVDEEPEPDELPEPEELPEAPGLELLPLPDPPVVAPVLPEPLDELPLVLDPPVLDCAAAIAGASATTATMKRRTSFCILASLGKATERY